MVYAIFKQKVYCNKFRLGQDKSLISIILLSVQSTFIGEERRERPKLVAEDAL